MSVSLGGSRGLPLHFHIVNRFRRPQFEHRFSGKPGPGGVDHQWFASKARSRGYGRSNMKDTNIERTVGSYHAVSPPLPRWLDATLFESYKGESHKLSAIAFRPLPADLHCSTLQRLFWLDYGRMAPIPSR
ncbi:hypothetical protein DL546_007873 [Coniochaeta pulveracea]|uniref:Uncharacterized protein n=1 Tax=Coniochaeta pulveracea TaxID=177199 RepID=A0A420YI70_9PEZI|nr:hypothetical protein DL546_007873 [Coniochaeta pulveracea]